MATNNLYKDIERSLKNHYPTDLSGNALKRVVQLASMVYAIVVSKKSGINSIANKLQGSDKQVESRAKQAQRWLDSKWTDSQTHFAPYTMPLLKSLASSGELVLCIDGSEVAQNCICLMVSAYYKKRAIPVAWVVRQGKKGHFPEQMHVDLVNMAASLLPEDAKVVFLGDGEFSGEKLINTLRKHRWDYVLRTKLNRQVDCGHEIAAIGEVVVKRGEKYVFLPTALSHSNAILWHEGKFEKPIPLLTNLDYAHQACIYYKKRFSIETMFSDIKSRGFNIHKAKMNQPERVAMLLIAVALAYLFIFLWGIAPLKNKYLGLIYRKDRQKDYSPFNIGCKIVDYCLENQLNIISLFSKNYDLFFCVRQ